MPVKSVIAEVQVQDLEAICDLIREVYGREPSEGFIRSFHFNTTFLGYKLLIDNNISGYLGCNLVEREIEGATLKFYNMHTWLVREKFRSHSLKLLLPYTKLQDGIVTNFTPTLAVRELLLRFKFNELRWNRMAFSGHFLKSSPLYIGEINSDIEIEHKVFQKIYNHHKEFACRAYSFQSMEGNAIYLLLRKTSLRHPLATTINKVSRTLFRRPLITNALNYYIVHYCSDWTAFRQNFQAILDGFLKQHKVGGLILSEDRFPDESTLGRQGIPVENEFAMFRSSEPLSFRLDQLFSEIFYLDVFNR